MTPALELTSPPTFSARLRVHRAQVVLGFGLGLAAALLVDGAPFGLGHGLFALMAAIALVVHAGKEAWQTARGHRWLLVSAVLLVASTALHTSTWLAALCVGAALLLTGLAVQGWTGERTLSTLRTGQLLAAPLVTFGEAVHAGTVVTGQEFRRGNLGAAVSAYGPAAARLVAIVAPPVLLVVLLLASGDAIFDARLGAMADAFFGMPLDRLVRAGFVTGIFGLVLTGVLALASRRRGEVKASAPARSLKALEAFALLASLSAVLLAFGLTSTPCALAPTECALPRGVTYAQAAHEGFFSLLFAALFILVLLMALPARTKLESATAQLTFTGLSTLLVLATLPMVVSAVARLWRYEVAYGLTSLRVMAYACLGLVAAVLVWRALTLWAFQHAFVGGALGLCVATLLGLAVMAPERLIAERNLTRENPDVMYLLYLSDDAVPALVAARPRLQSWARDEVRSRLSQRKVAPEPSPLTWNRGRARAREALATVSP